MNIGHSRAIRRSRKVWVPKQIVFPVAHGMLAADEQQRVCVVQQAHLVRGHQLAPRLLGVGGRAAVPPPALPVGLRVDGLLAQHLGDVLVRGGLIAAQVQQAVAVARYGLPGVLEQRLDLRKVLYDDGRGDLPAAHGGKAPLKVLRQRHIGKLVQYSCASLLLANGVPMKQIQEWLGHSDFSTTANIYAHLDYSSKLTSADAMLNGLGLAPN